MAASGEASPIRTVLDRYLAEKEPKVATKGGFDIRNHAARHRVLPVILDMGGCYALREDGEVVSYAWEEEEVIRPEQSPRLCRMVLFRASRKFPELRALAPTRSEDAEPCSQCAGSGTPTWLPENLASMVTCYCGGLGWLLPGEWRSASWA